MSEAKHTPGPWKWSFSINDPYSLEGADGTTIIRPVDGHVYSEYSADSATIELSSPNDARLIAAAPDMLMALIDLQVIAEQHIEDIAADMQEGRGLDPVLKMELARWSAVGSAIAKATGGTITSGQAAEQSEAVVP